MISQGLTGTLTVCLLSWLASSVQADPLLVFGTPGYDPVDPITGTRATGNWFESPHSLNNSGVAVAGLYVYGSSGDSVGWRAVRWNDGGVVTGLVGLSNQSSGYKDHAAAVNDSGVAVGYSRPESEGIDPGTRAVRWDAGSVAAIELGNLGTNTSGYTEAAARDVNNVGAAVGYCSVYEGDAKKGNRAVRWDAGGTAAIELGNLGLDSNRSTESRALVINDSGTAIGWSHKYVNGISKGVRPVRWDAGATTVTELGTLGVDPQGSVAQAGANDINEAGTIVGFCSKYEGPHGRGTRAVRWNEGSVVATELGHLGVSSNNQFTESRALAVNDIGTAIGWARKYEGGVDKGRRAVRWDAGVTAATELATVAALGHDGSGYTFTEAYALNHSGTAVGSSRVYENFVSKGDHAIMWLPDASAIDLNDLGVVPMTGGGSWTLIRARAISDDGWVAGEAMADGYRRLWVAQVGLGGSWTATDGVWGRGPNWSTGTPAMQVGNATFDLHDEYRVTLDRDERTKTIAVTAGTVTLEGNGHTLTTENGLTIAAGATLKPAIAIVGNVVNAGTLSPGENLGSLSLPSGIADEQSMSLFMAGPGSSLSITGNLTNSGILEFEIASPQLNDHLDLNGTLFAGGTIAVKLLDGYAPAAGSTFDLLDADQFTDNGFAIDLSAASLPSGLSWDTSALATTGSISVVPEPTTFALLICAAIAVLVCWKRQR